MLASVLSVACLRVSSHVAQILILLRDHFQRSWRRLPFTLAARYMVSHLVLKWPKKSARMPNVCGTSSPSLRRGRSHPKGD